MPHTALLERAKLAAEQPLDVTTGADLARAAKAWKRAGVLGVDTEFIRERTYYAKPALIQVSDGQTVWLVDPLCFDDLEPLAAMLRDPGIIKVLHAPSEDLELMQYQYESLPQPMFDTQLAATATGETLQISYNNLVEMLLGEVLDSSSTRSNWLRRPLSNLQRHYAALDVAYLPLIHGMLSTRLEALQRSDWHAEDCERMCNEAASLPDPEQMYLRIREAFRLDAANLRVLRTLTAWRERTARKRDRPRKYVLSDKNLFDIANRLPREYTALRNATDLHPRSLDRQAEDILRLIGEALDSTEAAPIPPRPMSTAERKLCSRMQQEVSAEAVRLDVAPTWLATRKDIEALIRSAGKLEENSKLAGWRKAIIGDKLCSMLPETGS